MVDGSIQFGYSSLTPMIECFSGYSLKTDMHSVWHHHCLTKGGNDRKFSGYIERQNGF